MTAIGANIGLSQSWTTGKTVSQEALNKTAEYCEKLCARYEERLQGGKSLGFWNTGIYLITDDDHTRLRGGGSLRSVLSGRETHWEPMRMIFLDEEARSQYLCRFLNPQYNLFLHGEEKGKLAEEVTFSKKIAAYAKSVGVGISDYIKKFETYAPEERENELEKIRRMQVESPDNPEIEAAWEKIRNEEIGHPFGKIMGGISTPINTEELAIIMNLPRKEIQGITIRESASFGANYKPLESIEDIINFGSLIHKREIQPESPVGMEMNHLIRHGFICGVTGSGKSNTCMNLLCQIDRPFMVIEPAKSEYRRLVHAIPDLKVFTLGNENVSPFRINPFEFIKGTELLTHIDQLKTVFNASFPMYASMPYLLEEAIVDVYLDKGWELATSTNRYFNVKSSEKEFYDYLPTLEDLYQKIDEVVAKKQYAQELSMDLSAALKARLSSLLTGSKGLMLNTKRSIPIESAQRTPSSQSVGLLS